MDGLTTIDQQIINWFLSLEQADVLLVLVSLLIAALLSGIIGFEREYHGHAAG